MPDERWPSVVKHPLDDAGRGVLVLRVGFEHRALPLVCHQLRLRGVVFESLRLAVARRHRGGEYVERLELTAASVKAPHVVDRPEVFGRQHPVQALDGRHCRAGAYLCGEAVRAAVLVILKPVGRRHPLVRAFHLYSGDA